MRCVVVCEFPGGMVPEYVASSLLDKLLTRSTNTPLDMSVSHHCQRKYISEKSGLFIFSRCTAPAASASAKSSAVVYCEVLIISIFEPNACLIAASSEVCAA